MLLNASNKTLIQIFDATNLVGKPNFSSNFTKHPLFVSYAFLMFIRASNCANIKLHLSPPGEFGKKNVHIGQFCISLFVTSLEAFSTNAM